MIELSKEDLYIQKGKSAGYLNVPRVMEVLEPYTFIFIIGGRGTGKTYGFVEYVFRAETKTFLLRRTAEQADEISKQALSPVKSFCMDNGIEYKTGTVSKSVKSITFWEDKEPLILTGPLSTLYNVRGFDGSDIELLLYDEFIPEPQARPITGEGEALLNIYETIARNRELKGEAPLKFVGLSNSNRLDNPIFADLNLVLEADKIFSHGLNLYVNKSRGVAIVNLDKSPISQKKAETALYKFAKGTNFAEMALQNTFRDYKSPQRHYKLTQLQCILNVGEIGVFAVKDTDKYYACSFKPKAELNFENTEKGLASFYTSGLAKLLWLEYLENKMYFENFLCESLFKRYCQASRKLL